MQFDVCMYTENNEYINANFRENCEKLPLKNHFFINIYQDNIF